MYTINLEQELRFTETYRRHQHDHPAIREAHCLRAQFPAILKLPQEGDLFAGRVAYPYVGFSPQEGPAGMGYYLKDYPLRRALEREDLSPATRAQIEELLAFWETEHTPYKVRAAYPPHMREALPTDNWTGEPGIGFPLYRMAGAQLDFDKLLRLGLPGLRAEVAHARAATTDADAHHLYTAMEMALDLLRDVCRFYADQVRSTAPQDADRLEMARVLERIADHPPATFREAMQLFWLYALVSGTRNYGRLDVFLGDFLARDLDDGRLTEPEALRLTQSMWRLMADRRFVFDGRVIVGGRGRRNPDSADRFALIAMEATRTVPAAEPQLSLRWHEGMNLALWEKALQVIGEGRTFPILYNDDVNVDAVMKAFRVSREEAEEYLPFGCGEYVLNHRSYGTPSGVINLLKALEAALHDGCDAFTGRRIGLPTGPLSRFETFEDLFAAYQRQVERYVAVLAEQEALEYRVAGETAPFLYLSMLYDDCIRRGKGIFAGGIRYLGGTLETYGNTSAADSLTAIKHLVYDRKALTLERLVAALDADFEGYEEERRLMLAAPMYGNDDDEADAMAVRVHNHVCTAIREQAERVGLHSYMAVIINNSANTTLGKMTAASADGRRAREPMSNGNNPSPGSDRSGVTAMLNSLVKLDPSIHAGAVQNMKFSPALFREHFGQTSALLKAYFESGGTQAMITVVSRGDLEAAMREPEKYQHIFVRVGGFSARFVELERAVQLEILARTLY